MHEHLQTFKHSLPALLLMAGMGFASTASASLEVRPGGMVYDTVLNITWLADANYAQTSGYNFFGPMNWATATNWAANLVYGGYDDWRLPTTLQPDATCSSQGGGTSSGSNCTGSELGHLFYGDINQGLGGVAGQLITNTHNANFNLFSNILPAVYWSSTEYAPSPGIAAWSFTLYNGDQIAGGKDVKMFAWAVRTGDVAAVPLPAAVWLFGSALTGLTLVGAKRRRG